MKQLSNCYIHAFTCNFSVIYVLTELKYNDESDEDIDCE